jgi:hypothetical protein
MDQHAFWVKAYVDLQAAEQFEMKNYLNPSLTYSGEAYELFPRYRLADDTLINIERIVFEPLTPIENVQQALSTAGSEAFAYLAQEMKEHGPAVKALELQLTLYRKFIESLVYIFPEEVKPLPFRRVLSNEESTALWGTLQTRWGIRGPGFGWFPLSDDVRPQGALTFHEELWKSRDGAAILQRFLREQGTNHCHLLRELGPPDYEIEIALANPIYDGSESFLFSDGGWVVYTSHESSLTLAGSVAEFFSAEWSDAEQVAYGGPYHTEDLRGAWNWP